MDALFTASPFKLPVGSSCFKVCGFRLVKKARTKFVCTSEVTRGLTCQGRAMCPRPLVATYALPTRFESALLRSHPVCLASYDGDIEVETSSGFHSSKPARWNHSYRNRINRAANDFDHSLYAAQGGLGGCDAHDSSVSRRDFLKSLIQGRMKNIDDTAALGGGGDGVGGGKGYGGSGGDGFGFGGLGGEDGFFIAGMGSWVLIGSAFCLVISLLAQIFRGAGSPSSRNNKGKIIRSNGNESEGLRTGSLSHSSRGVRYNRSPDRDPTPTVLHLASACFAAAESERINFRGLFTGTLYPSACIQPKAFYRRIVGSVGPKPGDWIETVDNEGGHHDATINSSYCMPRSLDGVVLADVKEESITQESGEDMGALMDQLQHVQNLLRRSEIKRNEALEDLKESNARNEDKRKTLVGKIRAQEAMNKKIRIRLEQIHQERDTLVHMLGDARGTVEGVLPTVEDASGQIDDLNKAVKTHKTNLRLMEKQLTVTSRERDAVLRRMESLQRDVNDIESLLDIVEKSRDLVSHCEEETYADRIQKADSCIQVLQQYLLRPTGGRQLSPIREVGNRIVVVFEKMMVDLKRAFMHTSKYVKQLESIQEKLSQSSQDESTLGNQLIELKAQYERLDAEKANIESTLVEMQHTLATAQENLDGNSKTEIELRGAMETLTCEKDTLSAMMRSIQREVQDIEGLTQIMEKTRELITQTSADQMGTDQLALLENCLNVLQQHHLKPTEPYEHVSRNISDRLVRVFENLLGQTKQSILKAQDSKGALKKVEDDLEGALSEESSLTMTIEGLRSQISEMASVKTSLSNDVKLLKNELDEKSVSLDQLRMELNSLDEVREEQNKDIEQLRSELAEKRKLLESSKQTEIDMTEALHKIGEERDVLQTKLQSNETDLDGLRQQLQAVLAEGKNAQEQLELLQVEKSNLETQLSGLAHRIKDFESENSRLTAVAQTLKSNLDNERSAKEQLVQEAEDIAAEKADYQEKVLGEMETLKGQLDNAQDDRKRLQMTCDNLEKTKQNLESLLEEESKKYDEQMKKLKKTYGGDPLLTGSADSEPVRQPEYQESPFATAAGPEPSAVVQQEEGSPVQAHTAEGTSQIQPAGEEEGYSNQGASKVLNWLDEADVDPWGVMPEGRDTNTAPPYESESSQLLSNLMPSAGPICERKIHRRLSWPQDMTFALNDNLLGAAQELVDMTTATLELAAEKNQLESELNEVRQAINEARSQLEEREAEVSDLTEHFLQVYQIASDLAADNEEQSTELRELRMTYERQKQDIESRDRRIAMLETEFAMHNMAPPPNTIVKNHFSEPLGNFPPASIVEAEASSFGNEEYDDGHGRLRSFENLGIHPGSIHGMTSPRFEAPGTPSMISTTMDINAPRAHSSATMTSVATKNYEEPDVGAEDYSFSELSSLSGADDESNQGYPDAEHYPMRVDMI